MKKQMKKKAEQKDQAVEILRYEVPYEYTNSIFVRRNKGGSFTLWILARGCDETVKDCWQRNLKTPKQFVKGFTECVEFVDFGGTGLEWLVRGDGAAVIKKLDKKFAASLVHFLTTDPEYLIEAEEKVAEMKRADEERSKGSKSTFRTLTMEEARREFPQTLHFTSSQMEAAGKGSQPKQDLPLDRPKTLKEAMAKATGSLMLLPEDVMEEPKEVAPSKGEQGGGQAAPPLGPVIDYSAFEINLKPEKENEDEEGTLSRREQFDRLEDRLPSGVFKIGSVTEEVDNWRSWDSETHFYLFPLKGGESTYALLIIGWDDNWENYDVECVSRIKGEKSKANAEIALIEDWIKTRNIDMEEGSPYLSLLKEVRGED